MADPPALSPLRRRRVPIGAPPPGARRPLGRRFRLVVVAAALLGTATGIGVVAFEAVVRTVVLERVLELPLALAALAPAVGLALTALLVRHAVPRGDPATTDAYVATYHEPGGRLRLRDLGGRLAASAATLGSGGAMGFEGPSILLGGTLGSAVERWLRRWVAPDDAKVLVVAGAAAGVAAIFGAPLTGVVFALEVPYADDLAHRALVPALVAAGTSYLVVATVLGTEPILRVAGTAPYDLADLGGALALGLACGLLARLGAWTIVGAKHLAAPAWARAAAGGAALAALAVVAERVYGDAVTLGSGFQAIAWAEDHRSALGLLLLLFALRAAATWTTVAAGGVGGLFFPLVTQGAITGGIVQAVIRGSNPTLFPTVGIAAFLGAGYRTPLAGVAFVAEATGRQGFIVPALLAAAVASLAMGRASFSPYQRGERTGHVERRLGMRVADVMTTQPDVVAPDVPVEAFVHRVMADLGRRWLPVVDGDRYLGSVGLAHASHVPPREWPHLRVAEIMRTDLPTVAPDAAARRAAALMHRAGVEHLAVVRDGALVGVVGLRDLVKLEQLLELVEASTPGDVGGRARSWRRRRAL